MFSRLLPSFLFCRIFLSGNQVLGLLMERLGNEMTRMATLKALAAVSVSPLKVDLKPILASATEELALFLRQQSRPLKQTTLETLLALINRRVHPRGQAGIQSRDSWRFTKKVICANSKLIVFHG